MVARREVDLAINTITITVQREGVVDFTNPYIVAATCVVSRAPVEKNRALAILRPFSLEVWLCLLGTVCSAGLVVLIVTLATHSVVPDSTNNPKLELGQVLWYSFNLFRSLVIQGNLLSPRRAAPRIVTLAWYFFCLNMYIVYSGILISFLMLPFFEKPIDSLSDLYAAIQERDILLTFYKDSSFEYMFTYAHADSGIYAQLGETVTENSYVNDQDATLLRILEGENIAYVSDFFIVTMTTNMMGRTKFHVGRQTFSPQPFAIALANGCPYVANFNKERIIDTQCVSSSISRFAVYSRLQRLQEFGLPDKWLRDAIRVGELQEGNDKYDDDDDDTQGPLPSLSLKHLQSALVLYGGGAVLGVVVLVVEVCYASCGVNKNHG
ncbi:glutamate receptor ionotropic, delta-2-like [Oratosquilla oratoria]|uniref:glutamate receptor ionotropic, delta-2-like n=1 Tax=Oratosquilla oratoria TaxID=337810 RepID=UPI003F771DAB